MNELNPRTERPRSFENVDMSQLRANIDRLQSEQAAGD